MQADIGPLQKARERAALLQRFADDAFVRRELHQHSARLTFDALKAYLSATEAAELQDAWTHYAAVPANADRNGLARVIRYLKGA